VHLALLLIVMKTHAVKAFVRDNNPTIQELSTAVIRSDHHFINPAHGALVLAGKGRCGHSVRRHPKPQNIRPVQPGYFNFSTSGQLLSRVDFRDCLLNYIAMYHTAKTICDYLYRVFPIAGY
jgi:hypothetical protein